MEQNGSIGAPIHCHTLVIPHLSRNELVSPDGFRFWPILHIHCSYRPSTLRFLNNEKKIVAIVWLHPRSSSIIRVKAWSFRFDGTLFSVDHISFPSEQQYFVLFLVSNDICKIVDLPTFYIIYEVLISLLDRSDRQSGQTNKNYLYSAFYIIYVPFISLRQFFHRYFLIRKDIFLFIHRTDPPDRQSMGTFSWAIVTFKKERSCQMT
jgi:hypothetical protein